jgi:hypothetical protein
MYVDVANDLAPCGASCRSGSMQLGGGFDYNKWEQNQYYVFVGTGAQVSVSASAAQDVGVFIYHAGVQAAAADLLNTGGTENVSFLAGNGVVYVANLVGFGATPGNYTVNLQFTSP